MSSSTRLLCRICGAFLNGGLCLDLGETTLANELPATLEEARTQDKFLLYIVECPQCYHVQLPVVVDPKRLFRADYPYQSGTSKVFCEHLSRLAHEIDVRVLSGSLLEIASNDGTFLSLMSEGDGWELSGVDPAGALVPGVEVYREPFSLEWATRGTQKYDVIVALNVLAHVDDLHDMFAGIAHCLAPDGLFVMEVGDWRVVSEKGLFDVIYHEHLSYHTPWSVNALCDMHGMHVETLETNDSQGGTIRAWIRHGRAELFDPPKRYGFDALEKKIADLRDALPDILGPGFNVYGCPAKWATQQAALRLEPMAVFDDNELKIGRFAAGCNYPILRSEQVGLPTLYIASWNFADDIIKRLRERGYTGRIVVPLPELRVLDV